ncbi:MAG: sugar ABC transporter substrate-binding protein [Elusimicrobiota bacterium]
MQSFKMTFTSPVKIRVAYWGDSEEKKVIQRTVREWEKNHPGIKINLEHIPAYYTEKILGEIAGNVQPDIIFCEANVFVTFFFKDVLLDMMPYIETDAEFHSDDYFPKIMQRFTRDGRIYCIPRDVAPFACVFYNKDMFKKANIKIPVDSWGMNDFLNAAIKTTKDSAGKNPSDPGFQESKIVQYGFWGWTWTNFVYAFGGGVVNDINNPTQCVLNSKSSVKGLQFYVDLMNKYNVSPKPDILSNMGVSSVQLFAMGKLAMLQSGIWETPALRSLVSDKFEWDVAMFPKGPGGKRLIDSGGSGYAILKTTKHPKESWEVVKWLTGDRGQEFLAESGLAQPANIRLASGSIWVGDNKKPNNKTMLNEAAKYMVFQPFHPAWREVEVKLIPEIMHNVMRGDMSVKDGADQLTKRINMRLHYKSEK